MRTQFKKKVMSKRQLFPHAIPLSINKDDASTGSPMTRRDRSHSPVESDSRSFIDLRTQRRRTSTSPVDLLASVEVGQTVLLSTKCDLLACGSTSNLHDSSSDEEFINLDQRVYKRLQKNAIIRDEEAAKTIELQAYEIKVLKATLRQYRKKLCKIERLTKAATARDDVLLRRANEMIEGGEDLESDEIKSESDGDDIY